MRHTPASVLTVVALALGVGQASAQTTQQTPPRLSVPGLTLSVGVMRSDDRDTPFPAVAVQHYFGRHLVLEGEVTRWRHSETRFTPGTSFGSLGGFSGDRTVSTINNGWTAGAKLLYRTAPRKVAWFAGGGILRNNLDSRDSFTTVGCVPPPASPTFCNNNSFSFSDRYNEWGYQVLTGVDVRVWGPVTAYGALQFSNAQYAFARAQLGVRLDVRTRDLAQIESRRIARLERDFTSRVPLDKAVGREVEVVLANGSRRTGRLVGITSTEVVLQKPVSLTELRYPVQDVRLVELASNSATTFGLVGLALGAATGVATLVACQSEECWVAIPLFAAIGGGAGAIAGGIREASRARTNVIWINGTSAVGIVPALGPKARGIGVAFRW